MSYVYNVRRVVDTITLHRHRLPNISTAMLHFAHAETPNPKPPNKPGSPKPLTPKPLNPRHPETLNLRLGELSDLLVPGARRWLRGFCDSLEALFQGSVVA